MGKARSVEVRHSVVEDAAKMRSTGGRVPCVSSGAGGCTSTWTIADIGDKLEKATHIVFSQALVQALFEAPKQKMELEAARAAAEAAAKAEGIRISEKVRRLRNVIVERDLTLHCPRCGQAFFDFQGCCALHCMDSCGAAFCGLCLADCGENAHPHLYSVHKGVNIYDKGAFETARRRRCREGVIAAVKDVSVDKEVCKLLIEELGKADLDELGMTMDELFEEVNPLFPDSNDLLSESTKLVQMIENEKSLNNRLPDDPVELVRLARQDSVRKNAYEIMRFAGALEKLAENDEGKQACVEAGSPLLLTELAKEKCVLENGYAARSVALALWNISLSAAGKQSCVDVGAASALVALAREKAVLKDAEVMRCVAGALWILSISDTGRQSCIDAGASSALTALGLKSCELDYGEAIVTIAGAFEKIARSDAGRQSCIDAGAPLVLSDLARSKSVANNVNAAKSVTFALWNISKSEVGKKACLIAGVPASLTSLSIQKCAKGNAELAKIIAGALWVYKDSGRVHPQDSLSMKHSCSIT